MHARPFFVHPYVQAQGRNVVLTRERQQHAPEATPRVNDTDVAARRPLPDPAVRGMMADMKLSLAAYQLSEQVKESIEFWRGFQNEYSMEVNGIQLYVRGDVLQQIWRMKVEYSCTSKSGGDTEGDQQFDIQSMKLESCLNQVDEVTRLLAGGRSSNYSSDYDSRQHYLEKVRTTGNIVVGLSKKSRTNEAACRDLLEELTELEKLIDSRSLTTNMHRFNKRQAQDATRAGEEGREGPSSNRSENGEANQQTENNPNWPATNGHDGWPAING